MAKNVKFERNPAGIRTLMQSPEMEAVCESKAKAILSSLGSGYTMTTRVGRNRVNAEIATDSPEARHENLKNNTILKALGAGR